MPSDDQPAADITQRAGREPGGLLLAGVTLRDRLDLQLVALPVLPVTGHDGEANRRALRAAAERGVDALGGCPHLDPDPRAAHGIRAAGVDEAVAAASQDGVVISRGRLACRTTVIREYT